MPETIPAPRIKKQLDALRVSIGRHIKGKDDVIERVVICLAAGGHLLIEDLPGLGKTTLAYCLARAVHCDFARVQFTSDLLPTDVIGVSIFDEASRSFVFRKGPLFTHILLADEINRTTPKTQSALLEAMDRSHVTVDGQTYRLEPPFMVFATQNPVDFEGTFPLPESQMDRFFMRLRMGYPEEVFELQILQAGQMRYDAIAPEPILTRAEVVQIQDWARQVYVEDSVLRYILKIVAAHTHRDRVPRRISTRGSLSLKLAAQAAALVAGRAFVIPEDVAAVVEPVLVHRLALRRQTADLLEERSTIEGILHRIVQSIPMPR
jgi:MoxR-like ATPase